MIPYPSNETKFYNTALQLDRGKKAKYWSTTVEMAARAFESYVICELKERNWTNDYLVCGLGHIYPEGEELLRINAAIKELLSETLHLLR